MFKPVEVKALSDYRLWVKYSDGAEGIVDLSHLAGKGVFSLWDNYSNFEKVHIREKGAIAWDDQVDVCPDSIYMRITKQVPEEVFPNLASQKIHA